MTTPIAVSPSVAAEMLGVSRAHIYKLIDRGEVRRSHIGRSARIPVVDLERLVGLDPNETKRDSIL